MKALYETSKRIIIRSVASSYLSLFQKELVSQNSCDGLYITLKTNITGAAASHLNEWLQH